MEMKTVVAPEIEQALSEIRDATTVIALLRLKEKLAG